MPTTRRRRRARWTLTRRVYDYTMPRLFPGAHRFTPWLDAR